MRDQPTGDVHFGTKGASTPWKGTVKLLAGYAVASIFLWGPNIASLVHRFYRGIPLGPAVSADYNGDGKQDFVYIDENGSRNTECTFFYLDGNDVTHGEDGVYRMHNLASPINGYSIADRSYSMIASDVDNDGDMDLMVIDRRLLEMDSGLATKKYDVLENDGSGNLKFSQELSKPSRKS